MMKAPIGEYGKPGPHRIPCDPGMMGHHHHLTFSISYFHMFLNPIWENMMILVKKSKMVMKMPRGECGKTPARTAFHATHAWWAIIIILLSSINHSHMFLNPLWESVMIIVKKSKMKMKTPIWGEYGKTRATPHSVRPRHGGPSSSSYFFN